jgi:sterol desaturase/sphingolipid hydroxylase (fatty acid hydroxylase superfamily)
LVVLVTISFVLGIELGFRRTRRIARTVGFNVAYALAMAALAWMVQPVAVVESGWVKRVLHLTPLPLPSHGYGIILSAAILMLAADFIFYWVHRAQHRFDWLWAMHSFHHSDDDINAASAYRHYWIEKPAWMLVFYLPLGLVFQIAPAVASAYALVFQFFALFPHMNMRLEMGPLSRVFLGPQVHRIHHSIYAEHFNTNFAGAFPIWDSIFGTYRSPARGEFPPTGVPYLPGRPSLTRTVLWPFMIAEQDSSSSAAESAAPVTALYATETPTNTASDPQI